MWWQGVLSRDTSKVTAPFNIILVLALNEGVVRAGSGITTTLLDELEPMGTASTLKSRVDLKS